MKIALFSDLHREFNQKLRLEPSAADVIVLAGDIDHLDAALELAQELGAVHRVPVLYVPGNHEYYGHNVQAVDKWLDEWRDPAGWVQVLRNRSLVIDGVKFIGTTLWSDFGLRGAAAAEACMSLAARLIPDFRSIRMGDAVFTPADAVLLNRQARQFLQDELVPATEPCVVVSHFAPHSDCCAEHFIASPLTPYFINDCAELIHQFQPRLWMFGHTHHSVDYHLGATRVLSNQHGYPHEIGRSSGFNMGKIVELHITSAT